MLLYLLFLRSQFFPDVLHQWEGEQALFVFTGVALSELMIMDLEIQKNLECSEDSVMF